MAAALLLVWGLWRATLPRSTVGRAWLAFLVVTATSALVGYDPAPAFLGDPVRMMGLLGWVVVAAAWALGASRPDVPVARYAQLLVGVGAVASTIALLQGVAGSSRPGGPMGNPVFLGAILCLALPVGLHMCVMSVGRLRALYALAEVVMGVALVLSQARGAALGVAVGFAVLAVAGRRRWIGAALVAFGVALVLLLPVARDTATGRLDTWRETADVIAERPLLGWGPEGFRAGFARHVSAKWVRTYGLEQVPDRAHNAVLDVTVSSGVLGAAAYLALLVVAGRSLWRAERSPIAVAVAAGVTAYVVQAQFSFDTFDTAAIAWLLVGAVGATREAPRVDNFGPLVRLLASTVAVAAAMAFASDRFIRAASGRSPELAVARLHTAARLWPHSFDAGSLLATTAVSSSRPSLEDRAREALADWPDPYVQLRLAPALDPAAFDALALSLQDALPTNAEVYALLAQRRLDVGDDAGACEALGRAVALSRDARHAALVRVSRQLGCSADE